MKASKFSKAQIAFVLKQAEDGLAPVMFQSCAHVMRLFLKCHRRFSAEC